MQSYSRPPPFTWPPVTPRTLLPIFPPPEPLEKPGLPSSTRLPAFDAPYTLSSHIFPAAYLRTTELVPVPPPPPSNVTKAERQDFARKTAQKLQDLRVTREPQGTPQILWNCVNRYVKRDLDTRRPHGITLFLAHANGFPKEIWEPTLQHLLNSSVASVIDEVWSWEAVQHGDSCLLNNGNLGGLFDWMDNTRDILNFLLHYLPSVASSSPLPTHLIRIPPEESDYRKTNSFRHRTFVAVGHSLGGCTSALAALTHPALFSSLVLIDPVIIKPFETPDHKEHGEAQHNNFTLGALLRRETWSSQKEALEILSKSPFFGAWDPEVLKIYIECGTYPTRNPVTGQPIIRLKMPGIQEAVVFSEVHTEHEVFHQMPSLDERIELRWVMPGKPGAKELGMPGSNRERVWLRPRNASNIRIHNADHLIPHEAPTLLAHDLEEFIRRRYMSPRSNL